MRSGLDVDIHTGFFHLDKWHPLALQALHQAVISYDPGSEFRPLTLREVTIDLLLGRKNRALPV